jgi:hypothetical protein
MRTTRLIAFAALLSTLMTACGGGSDAPATAGSGGGGSGGGGGGGGGAITACDTTLFVAGTVETPTADQLAPYAGTYVGGEGQFGPNPGDPFVKANDATLVLAADGSATYKGTAVIVTSVCRDKAAQAGGAFWVYVHTAQGHVDVTDAGTAFGVSLTNGIDIFQDGVKQ